MAHSQNEADYVAAARVGVDQIPIIDFAPFLNGGPQDRQRVADEIAEACGDIGFFYLKNHGVPAEAVARVRSQSGAFFARPEDERAKSRAIPDWHRGWHSGGLSSRSSRIESFRIQTEHPRSDSPDPKIRHLYGPNRWPDDMPGFRADADNYFALMTRLSAELRHAFALGLGLPEDRFDGFFSNPLYQLSMLHYQALDADAPAQAVNSTPHTDEGPFTILWQDSTGGLEVKRRDDLWIAAPPIPDTFVINIGDMMMWWSNGRYRSTLHKVRNTSGGERFSIPFFVNPDGDADVGPLPEFVAADGLARYPTVNVGDRMMQFAPAEIRTRWEVLAS